MVNLPPGSPVLNTVAPIATLVFTPTPGVQASVRILILVPALCMLDLLSL